MPCDIHYPYPQLTVLLIVSHNVSTILTTSLCFTSRKKVSPGQVSVLHHLTGFTGWLLFAHWCVNLLVSELLFTL